MKAKAELTATLDQGAIIKQVSVINEELAVVRGKLAGPPTVQDDEDYAVVCSLLIATVEKRKKIEEWRAGFLAKVQELVAYVDDTFGPTMRDAATMEDAFRSAVQAYAVDLDEQAHSKRLAAAKLPAKDEKRAIKLLEEANAIVPPKIAGISIVTKVKAEIISEQNLPEWAWKKVVDTKAVESKLAAGEKVTGAKALIEKSVRVTPKHAAKGAA